MSEDDLRSIFRESPAKQRRKGGIRLGFQRSEAAAPESPAPEAKPTPESRIPVKKPTSRAAKRRRRAERLRETIFSPQRILIAIFSIPVIAAGVAVSMYIRTSPHEPQNALLHLVAMSGCEGAALVGLAPATKGRLGYHEANDADGNGVACEPADEVAAASTPRFGNPESEERIVGGARFLKP